MELALVTASLVLSLCAVGITVALYVHREDFSDARAQIRSLQLETAELVDRLSVWQRRDAQRQRRSMGGDAAGELSGPQPDQHAGMPSGKQQLREVARARGLIK
jgi:hypothetical protein